MKQRSPLVLLLGAAAVGLRGQSKPADADVPDQGRSRPGGRRGPGQGRQPVRGLTQARLHAARSRQAADDCRLRGSGAHRRARRRRRRLLPSSAATSSMNQDGAGRPARRDGARRSAHLQGARPNARRTSRATSLAAARAAVVDGRALHERRSQHAGRRRIAAVARRRGRDAEGTAVVAPSAPRRSIKQTGDADRSRETRSTRRWRRSRPTRTRRSRTSSTTCAQYKTLQDASRHAGRRRHAAQGVRAACRRASARTCRGIFGAMRAAGDVPQGGLDVRGGRLDGADRDADRRRITPSRSIDMMEAMRRSNVTTYAIDPRGKVESKDLARECFPPPHPGCRYPARKG